MINNTLLKFLLIFPLTVFFSCSAFAGDNERFIQGSWRLEGELPKNNNERSMSWYLEWNFTDGKFVQTGYPPIKQEGKYRIIKTEENKLILELYEQSGNFGNQNRQIEIIIDEKNNTLDIDDKKGFKEVIK